MTTAATPPTRAIESLRRRRVVPSTEWMSADWWAQEVPAAIRGKAFWSARNMAAQQLQEYKSFMRNFLEKQVETVAVEGGRRVTRIKAGGRQQFVRDIKERYGGGYGKAADEGSGAITKHLTTSRLELIATTQTRQAYERGQWDEGNSPEILDAFPAARFVRIGFVQEPRPLHAEHEGEVRLKSDLDFWRGMNAPDIGGFDTPFPPFGYNSQMGLEDVPREEAEALGLISPTESIKNPADQWREKLEQSVADLDPEVRRELIDALGADNVTEDGDLLRWK